MIITQTPLRISFFGGGTDYPAHYKRHGGATLSSSINKYTIITVQHLPQFATFCARVNYSRVESVNSIDEIQHPSARECLRFLGIQEGVEIHYLADLPARTGLGSSSSATAGLLMALHAYKGEVVSREQVAAEAVYVEQELIKERVGSQDQYACALGGFMRLQFYKDLRVQSDPVVLLAERLSALQNRLLLLYTGIQRRADEILDEQLQRTESGELTQDLCRLQQMVDQALVILTGNHDLSEFGALLHDGWLIKRRLSSKISLPGIDGAYERARMAGAIGGKLLGAGSGGFLLLFVEPEHRQAVLRAVPELRITEFAMENSGSRIIFYR